MRRGGIDGMESRQRMVDMLPALMQSDDLTSRWVAALDEVLAPIVMTIDSLDAYLDPRTAPVDFLEWLGGWVGLQELELLPEATRRELVSNVANLYAMRGTLAGLAHALELLGHARVVSITDDGGVTWSQDPSEAVPGAERAPVLTVQVRGDQAEVEQTAELVQAWAPAHVTAVVEVLPT